MHEFEDLNFKFSITRSNSTPSGLCEEFIDEMSLIDKILIDHYLNLNLKNVNYFILSQEDVNIGYGKTVEENGFVTIYELFVQPKYRELGFGTQIFNQIRDFSNSINHKIRTITLPSDRTGKNFYESNLITARVLIMEEKRENSRYRP